MATKQASPGMDLTSSLSQALKTLRTSLQALQTPSSSSSSSANPFIPPLLPGLPDIVTQLTATLKQTTTSLALSFKPPITTDAAVAQLDKLSDQVGRLIACVIAAAAGGPWDRSALVEEWREGVLGLSTELEKLLVILQKAAAEPSTGRNDDGHGEGEGEGAYLVHTGLVWGAVDRMTDGMSTDEVGAVVRVWKKHGEVVRDAWDEFKEFLEDAQEDDGGGGDDGEDEAGLDLGDEDGEWGDLEKALGGSKMSPAERARAEAAKPLLGLHHILHATVCRHIPLLSSNPQRTFRPLLDTSSDFLAAFDTAISAMYPEQDVAEVDAGLTELAKRSKEMVEELVKRLDEVEAGSQTPESANKEKRQAFRQSLDKWTARLEAETAKWNERKLDLSSLSSAL